MPKCIDCKNASIKLFGEKDWYCTSHNTTISKTLADRSDVKCDEFIKEDLKPGPLKIWAEDMTNKFPVKSDHDRLTVGEIMEKLADLIDKDAIIRTICDHIDREFLFGAWGDEMKEIASIKFVKDMRGAIVAAYKLGKKRGANVYEPVDWPTKDDRYG